MTRSTPWGPAHTVTTLADGFDIVTTATHGGMMITEAAANKYLSEAALKRAFVENGYYCYEEDVDSQIPLFDAHDIRRQFVAQCNYWRGKSDKEVESDLLRWLSVSHPDYLVEKGVDPNKPK